MTDLQQRRVLVTGASSGIGAAVAARAAKAGAAVAVLARSAERLEALAGEIGAVAVPGDVTDPSGIAEAVDRAARELGGLDALVNNAGVARPGGVSDGDPDDWRLMYEVNVLGLLNATHAALPHLRRAPRADIVNVSSLAGRRVPSASMAVYSGTKHAVHAISEGLRKELADTAIRVIVLSPGFVRTGIYDEVHTDIGDRYREKMTATGLDPDVVGAQVVHALTAPADVQFTEIALISTRQ
jgi:NADP-dependent 3-hydroxy acid dehydrogenase YdfG